MFVNQCVRARVRTWEGEHFSKEILYPCHVCSKSSCNIHLNWLASSGYFYFFLGLSLQVSMEHSYNFFISPVVRIFFVWAYYPVSFVMSFQGVNWIPICQSFLQIFSHRMQHFTPLSQVDGSFTSILFLSLPLNSFKIGLAVFSKLQAFFSELPSPVCVEQNPYLHLESYLQTPATPNLANPSTSNMEWGKNRSTVVPMENNTTINK